MSGYVKSSANYIAPVIPRQQPNLKEIEKGAHALLKSDQLLKGEKDKTNLLVKKFMKNVEDTFQEYEQESVQLKSQLTEKDRQINELKSTHQAKIRADEEKSNEKDAMIKQQIQTIRAQTSMIWNRVQNLNNTAPSNVVLSQIIQAVYADVHMVAHSLTELEKQIK